MSARVCSRLCGVLHGLYVKFYHRTGLSLTSGAGLCDYCGRKLKW